MPEDHIGIREGYFGIKTNLRNLRPFVSRHWRKGLLGAGLVFFTSLFAFPQPLIMRYLVDDIILGRRLELLVGAICLFVGITLAGKLLGLLQEFYFTLFEKRVILDIQEDLLNRVLRFPKAFFDKAQTGYLMRRISSDVEKLRWFFSSTIVHIVSNTIRFVGGVGLLFYLEWRLAVIVLVLLPGIVFALRFFSGKIHVLSHQNMEREAKVTSRYQESISSVSLIKAFSSEAHSIRRMMSELRAAFQISVERSTVNSVAKLATTRPTNRTPYRGCRILFRFRLKDGSFRIGSAVAKRLGAIIQ